jgi:hypothetical protein
MLKFKTLVVTVLLTSSLQAQATPLASWTETTWNSTFLNDVLMNDKKDKRHAKAKDACENKHENDSCEFEGKKGVVKGTCKKTRKDDELICKPKGKKPKPHSKPESKPE